MGRTHGPHEDRGQGSPDRQTGAAHTTSSSRLGPHSRKNRTQTSPLGTIPESQARLQHRRHLAKATTPGLSARMCPASVSTTPKVWGVGQSKFPGALHG